MLENIKLFLINFYSFMKQYDIDILNKMNSFGRLNIIYTRVSIKIEK